ncbi:MAG TPA: ATP-binding protein [Candidatus Sulfotelmatobacter sp.]|nr:ATP-binding protein [Candidatus Sulfotelmatobacter sp.]
MTIPLGHIRTRLTLWYVAIFGLLFAAYICSACSLQYWQLKQQLYHAEVQDMETVQGLLYFAADGQLSLHEGYFNRPESRLLLDRLLEVLDPTGRVLFRNQKLNGNTLGGKVLPDEGVNSFSRRSLHLADGTPVLVISHVHVLQETPVLIRLAYSTQPLRSRTLQLLGLLAVILPFALIAAGFAGYRLACKVLDPLERMARTTERITAHRLNERIPIKNPDDELGHMALVLNGLLERLEESFEKLQHFTSDVSHELRTPLAAMRSVGEVGLQDEHDTEKYRDIIGSMLEEVAKLTAMVDTLLTIAHADSGAIQLQQTKFPLTDLVDEAVAVVSVLAEDKKQTLSVKGDPEVQVSADRGFLRMALVNLLDNAVKYSPYGSTIRVSLRSLGTNSRPPEFVELAIQDEGPGIPEASQQRIFDRFYRLDEARTRDSGGFGLGLPIAKWVVEAHGGKINVKAALPGGALFSIKLPIAAAATAGSPTTIAAS